MGQAPDVGRLQSCTSSDSNSMYNYRIETVVTDHNEVRSKSVLGLHKNLQVKAVCHELT